MLIIFDIARVDSQIKPSNQTNSPMMKSRARDESGQVDDDNLRLPIKTVLASRLAEWTLLGAGKRKRRFISFGRLSWQMR